MAKAIGMSISVYELKLKMKTSFTFGRLFARTITNKEYVKMFPRPRIDEDEPILISDKKIPPIPDPAPSEFGYLLIYGTAELESFESGTYVGPKIRPQLLVLHGILTFLTGKSIMAYESFEGHFQQVEYHIEKNDEKPQMIVEGIDISDDLIRIIDAIEAAGTEDQKVLIFTLLERWRKAVFLKEESEEVNMHIDEAVLSFFQILEVLADEYSANLATEIELQKQKLVEELSALDKALPDFKKKLLKFTNQIGELKITARAKIVNMLEKMELSSEVVGNFIKRYAEYRNAIAHGRKNIYQHSMIYPVESVFSFIKDVDEESELIKLLSAAAISKHLNLECWQNEWWYMQHMEQVPVTTLNDQLKDRFYEKVDTATFLKMGYKRLFPYTFFYHYVRGKLTSEEMELALNKYLLEAKITKANYNALFNCCCILCDSKNKELAIKSQKFILKALEKSWVYRSEVRDMYHYLDYYNVRSKWLYDWLSGNV